MTEIFMEIYKLEAKIKRNNLIGDTARAVFLELEKEIYTQILVVKILLTINKSLRIIV